MAAATTMATMTAPSPVSLQKPLSILKNGELAVRQRLKKTDPSHLNCFGDECFRLSTSFSKIIGWRIIGDLRATALDLQNTFLRLINEKRPYSQDRRPKNYSSPFHAPTYSLESFLIGPDQSHASPHLTIVAAEEWVAARLKVVITGSKILKNFSRWGCFKLPASITVTCQTTHHIGFSPGHRLPSHEYKVCISGDIIPPYFNGASVEIWKDDLYIGNATVGGFLVVGHQTLALTVAHVFSPRQPISPIEPFAIDESEFEFLVSDSQSCEDDDSDLDSDSGFADETLYESSLSTQLPRSYRRPDRLGPEEPASQALSSNVNTKTTIGYLEHISKIGGANEPTQFGLDWALLTITHPSIAIGNIPHLCVPNEKSLTTASYIDILTPSAIIRTKLVSNAVFGLPFDASPQSVLVASDGSTTQGDSGSWVIRVKDGKVMGMLIGNCQPLNQCYLLSMDEILSDIEAQTGLPVKVAPIKVSSLFEQPIFRSFVSDQGRLGVDGNGKATKYITAPKLIKYWSQGCVFSHLTELGIHFHIFSQSYLRLFSILTYIGKPAEFPRFFSHGIDDSQLPLERDDLGRYEMEGLFDLFEEYQWLFCPLEFDKSRLDLLKLHPKTILPIISQEMLPSLSRSKKYAFARVLINEECNISMPSNNVIFKTYDLSDTQSTATQAHRATFPCDSDTLDGHTHSTRNDWLHETEAYKALRERGGSKHMIEYYGSFSQGAKGTIILEDSNGVPLADFLCKERIPKDASCGFQFWQNLFELLKGLERIHNLPEAQKLPSWLPDWTWNITHSSEGAMNPTIMAYPAIGSARQQPRFKLVGFGLSPLHCGYNKSRPDLAWDLSTNSTQFNAVSPSIVTGSLSRPRADVWAFGRIVLHCAAWMLFGFDGWPIPGHEETFCRWILGYAKAGNDEEAGNAELNAIYQKWRKLPSSNTTTQAVTRIVLHHTPRNGPQTSQSTRQLYRDFHDNLHAYKNKLGSWTSRSTSVDSKGAGSSSTSNALKFISDLNWIFGGSHPQGLVEGVDPLTLAKFDWYRPTVEDINKWMRDLTSPDISPALSWQRLTEAKFDLKDRLNALDERDHVFFVDNSASMAVHWEYVTDTIKALEAVFEIAQPVDDRVDLYLKSDPIIGYRKEKTGRLVDILKTKPVGGVSTMGNSLEVLIDRIITQNIGIGDDGAPGFASTSLGRPISIYVLTDGIWQSPGLDSSDAALAGAENPIYRLVREVNRRNKSKDFVILQFIRFGNSEAGGLRLKHLEDTFGGATSDSSKSQASNSITFGVTFDTGSVWEMLGGSTVSE
ncbi:hypothetical protein F4824DRAFT_156344 [Ustulina deusta]|nr:hypothetical protein F4824DRAFT_156344 [Ustulina deusta]